MESDDSILQEIENGSLRVAQTKVQKLLKKYPKKLYYHALNCLILLKSGMLKEATEQSLQLKEKIPSDPATLKILYDVFMATPLNQADASHIYENAIKKYPSNDLITSWFDVALKNLDLRALQKSAMALQKLSKSRHHCVMAATLYYLLLINNGTNLAKVSDSELALFPKLAIKLLESVKPYNTEQEVYLLVKLLRNTGENEQAIAEIEAFYGGSTAGKTLDLELQIALLELYETVENWEKLYNYAHQLIFDDNFDDFDTWKHLIRASIELNKDISGLFASSTSYRNSYLARAVYAQHNGDSEAFNSAIAQYYVKFKGKLCCFNDIKYFCEEKLLDRPALVALLKDTSAQVLAGKKYTEVDLNVLVNNQKLLLLFVPEEECPDTNIELYGLFSGVLAKKKETDYFAGNEFILMKVHSLLANSDASNHLENVFRSIVFLELAAERDVHEARLKLWLMKLYTYISAHTIADGNFTALKVKMIQNDTLSHYIGTRISTLNPNNLHIQKYTTHFQMFYLNASQEIDYMLSNGFKKLSINKLQGFLEFGNRMYRSLTFKLNLLELSRTSKLTGNTNLTYYSADAFTKLKDEDLTTTFDNRDYSSEWKFGTQDTDKVVDDALRIGPKQGGEYFNAYYYRELILQETNPRKAKGLVAKLSKALVGAQLQLTAVESWTFKIYSSLFKLYFVNPNNDADYNFLIKNLNIAVINGAKVLGWSNKSELSSDLITWRLNHKFINIQELCRNITQFTTSHNLPKEYSPKVVELKKKNANLVEALRELKTSLRHQSDQKLNELETATQEWAKALPLKTNVDQIFTSIRNSIETSATARRV